MGATSNILRTKTQTTPPRSYHFKHATEPWELDQICRLNYETFVLEIPQHEANSEGILVDQFHAENDYIICLLEKRVVGMVAIRAERPFSLDLKLPNLNAFLPKAESICEVRLLAVHPMHRRGRVFAGLYKKAMEFGKEQGYQLAIISGLISQLKLYSHIGCKPFGPRVGSGDALFQPMFLVLDYRNSNE